MAVIEIKKAAGLVTQPNELDTVPGALTVAENVEITRDGVIEVARGFQDYSTNLPDFTPEQLFVFDGVAYLHLDSGIWYKDSASGNWYRKRASMGAVCVPNGFCYLSGALYITTASHTIVKLDLTTGIKTIIAGRAGTTGSTDGTGDAARFNNPAGICTDGTNLWVTDVTTHIIRKIVISTGVVTTFAGTAGASGVTDATGSLARFNNPLGITMIGTDLYVTDNTNNSIRKITSGAVVTTFAGSTVGTPGTTDDTGTAARFTGPRGITAIGTNLYVADGGNHSIRKITSGAVVTTFAGTSGSSGLTDDTGAAARFSTPTGVNSNGTDLFVVELGNDSVRKIIVATQVVTTPYGTSGTPGNADGIGAAARFNQPYDIVYDGVDLYVADNTSALIRKIYVSTGYVATIDGTEYAYSSGTSSGGGFAAGIVQGPP